ncbi:MAG: hypothetical protein RLY70_4666 [Planctomycetota bacterium]|jgi:hypothetical protein
MKNSVNVSAFVVILALFMVSATRDAFAQPAPALSEMRVIGVASPMYKNGTEFEKITANNLATPNDHGGNWLIVLVEERGYANGQFATLGGMSMKLAKSEPLVGFDRKVYGYLRYYTYEKPFTSGRFKCSASSLTFPWGTKTAWLNIR